jgi:hypothetical protein
VFTEEPLTGVTSPGSIRRARRGDCRRRDPYHLDMDVPPESWLDPRVVVRPSSIHGRGLFASRPIRAGEVLLRLGGATLSDADVRQQIERGERYDGLVLDEDLNLRIMPADWPGIYGNHSCDPNIWLTAPVDLAARRDIGNGEEIVSDYATYTMATGWSLDCACGSDVCRKTVTGDDWRRPDLQRRYAGHFARPIKRRISPGRTTGGARHQRPRRSE